MNIRDMGVFLMFLTIYLMFLIKLVKSCITWIFMYRISEFFVDRHECFSACHDICFSGWILFILISEIVEGWPCGLYPFSLRNFYFKYLREITANSWELNTLLLSVILYLINTISISEWVLHTRVSLLGEGNPKWGFCS